MSYNAKNYTEQGGDVTHIGGTLVFEDGAAVNSFPLEKSTANKLGGVKVGSGLNVTSDGVLSVAAASADAIGGVKVGTGLSIDAGVLSVNAASESTAGTVKVAENLAASEAVDVAGLLADFNNLLASLKAAGIMAADAAAEG